MRNRNVWFARSMRVPQRIVLGIMCAGIVVACGANAMAIDGAVVNERVFNDDPASTLITTNNYPALVQISDTPTGSGFANLHNFHLADAGVEHSFANDEPFTFSADLTISGRGPGRSWFATRTVVVAKRGWYVLISARPMAKSPPSVVDCLSIVSRRSQGLTYIKGTTVRVRYASMIRTRSAWPIRQRSITT